MSPTSLYLSASVGTPFFWTLPGYLTRQVLLDEGFILQDPIRIKNWDKFQHYKNRKPPWLKLYRDLLDNLEYRQLSDFSARLLFDLWLLASESEIQGEVDPDINKLAWRLRYASKTIADYEFSLKELMEQGFIEFASIALATCKQDAIPETEGETEREREKTLLSGSPDAPPRNDKNQQRKKDALEVIEFLNEKTGRNYRPVDSNLRMILARLKEYTLVELRQVVAKKTREWGPDEKMEQYLRPATLFNAKNCAQYVGELGQRPIGDSQ